MKALVLAAGFGKRLRPYTDRLPKPLFPLEGRPILERAIHQLIDAGCEAVMVNTHHLHRQVETFIKDRYFPVPVFTRHEPEILETGGAIRNVRDFFDSRPFMVVNSDIVTDMDYAGVYACHMAHGGPVTLVLHDFPEFNHVTVDKDGNILGFHLEREPENAVRRLAFTGVQVVDPAVIDLIPEGPSSSIDLYRTLIERNIPVRAMIPETLYWRDVGSPSKYAEVCREVTAPTVFRMIFNTPPSHPVTATHLAGDGSDRVFYRLSQDGHTMILADHGITLNEPVCEAAAYERIGRHLMNRGLPVPKIYWGDRFAGHVYLEDLGDTHLETVVKQGASENTRALYRDALKSLARMSVKGAKGFLSKWTFQTERYDKPLIVERECRYFMDAFVKGCLGQDLWTDELAGDFSDLADLALRYGCDGFMHRDFQSRNILVKDGRCYFIDFQSGRLGPVQYDLASLLIDPYTGLDPEFQDELVDFFIREYRELKPVDTAEFLESYRYLKITRNLQMLGAFGFLSKVKGKTWFAEHIPLALANLRRHLGQTEGRLFKNLKKIVDKI